MVEIIVVLGVEYFLLFGCEGCVEVFGGVDVFGYLCVVFGFECLYFV